MKTPAPGNRPSLSRPALAFTLAAAIGLPLSACVPPGDGSTVASDVQGLYGLGSVAAKWPGGNVPVCFTNLGAQPSLQGKIPGILANSWTRAANIHFSGFGACNGGNVVAVSFAANTNGVTDNLGYGQRSVTLISNDTPDLTHFQYEVIHELGHAIGWEHEMKRPDNWVGGVAGQCGVGNGSNDPTQFSSAPGGVNLTPNYDPDSIMNYCDPGGFQTTLSVGDVIGSSSASGYGPGQCVFASASSACTARPQLQYDSTWTLPAGCPAVTGSWILKQVGVGAVATAPEANTWLLGHQAEGGVTSGPAIGSSPQYQMCDAFNNCSPAFSINITDCGTKLDSIYVAYNQTLTATQGSSGSVTLEMVGPWMNYDFGIGAVGSVVSTTMPNATNATFHFDPGYSNNQACYPNCIGFMNMTASPSFAVPVGNYTATVKVYDPAIQIARTTVVPIAIGACTPPPPSCAGLQCGDYSGCGQTLHCGTCAVGNVCSIGHCCPSGDVWDGAACSPPPPPLCNCKPGFYCDAGGACVKVGNCKPGTCM